MAKDAAAEAKQEKARVAKVKAECTRVLAKTQPGLASLQGLLNDCDFEKLPALFISQIKDLFAELRKIHNEAQSQQEAAKPVGLSFEMEAVNSIAKDISSIKTGAAGMLQSIKKMSRN